MRDAEEFGSESFDLFINNFMPEKDDKEYETIYSGLLKVN